MAQITLKGNNIHTIGEIPVAGEIAPDFTVVSQDLSEQTLADSHGQRKILNIFPSIDTGVCAQSVRRFNELASEKGLKVWNISMDLPFALSRFCSAEGIKNVQSFSAFRSGFPRDYGLEIVDGPLAGLCARAVIILDENHKVLYSELVPEIGTEPDYEAALGAL
ncbi:MAG: lipid hydroperoxide peroxidase [Waddliaceae bacterium]|nr:lipid hydroperoxide peroxidase [Waddliaceae bacterium]